MKSYLLIVCVVLAGCVKVNDGATNKGQLQSLTQYDGGTGLVDFRLQDGTRCVAIMSRAITCDWKGESHVE